MTSRDELAAGTYLALTTFRRAGDPVSSPVWVVPLEHGRVGFWTAMGSGKTKRLAHTPPASSSSPPTPVVGWPTVPLRWRAPPRWSAQGRRSTR